MKEEVEEKTVTCHVFWLLTVSSSCAESPPFNHVVAVMMPASTWPSLYNVHKGEYKQL